MTTASSVAIIAASVSVLSAAVLVGGLTSKKEPPFNELCHNEKIADYDLTWNRIYEAQISLELCNEQPEGHSDPTDYCKLHADMEAKILEAVPCMRSAIRKEKELGILDQTDIRVAEAQLNEYLAMRHDPNMKAFDEYTQDTEVMSIP